MAATKELVQKIIGQSYLYSIFLFLTNTFFVIMTVLSLCFLHVVYYLLSFLYSESKDGTKSKGRKGAKNSATAAKVALMKLKLHAAGDKGLPQVFFKIITQ